MLKDATALHRTTVTRRLAKLVGDGLALEREGLFLHPRLAGLVRLQRDDQLLDHAAE